MARLNPKQLLGLDENIDVSVNEINRIYRRLSLQFHPDTSGFDSALIFDNIKTAVDTLKGIKIMPNEIDRYVVIKKLYEIYNKQEHERSFIDNFLIIFLDRFRIVIPKNVFNSYDNLITFLNTKQNEENFDNFIQCIKFILSLYDKILEAGPNYGYKTNFINIFNEVNRIRILGSSNSQSIRKAATIGQIFHILSILKLPFNLFSSLSEIGVESFMLSFAEAFNVEVDKGSFNKANNLALLSNILPSISACKFVRQDCQIKRDAEKIAHYNKVSKRNLGSAKLKQLAWLGINKIAPFVGFSLMTKKNSIQDCISISKDRNAVQIFNILKALADCSEIVRKQYRYKLEMGEYKKSDFIDSQFNNSNS